MKRSSMKRSFLLLVLSQLALAPAALLAQTGDLTVTPTRAVFEGRTRTAQIHLVNRGAAPATYRVSFTQMRMDAEGQFEEIHEPAAGERFADAMIRYSPRQVTLAPGESQTVRLLLRKPADLEPGEYRSHLAFHAIPPEDVGASLENLELEDEQIGIRLVPIYQVRIPVIVRHGELEAAATLSELELRPGDGATPPALSLRLERRGERSLYGDVAVSFVPDGGGPEIVVCEIDGLAVYVPNAERRLLLPLHLPEGMSLDEGRLRVLFTEALEDDDADTVRAVEEIALAAVSG